MREIHTPPLTTASPYQAEPCPSATCSGSTSWSRRAAARARRLSPFVAERRSRHRRRGDRWFSPQARASAAVGEPVAPESGSGSAARRRVSEANACSAIRLQHMAARVGYRSRREASVSQLRPTGRSPVPKLRSDARTSVDASFRWVSGSQCVCYGSESGGPSKHPIVAALHQGAVSDSLQFGCLDYA